MNVPVSPHQTPLSVSSHPQPAEPFLLAVPPSSPGPIHYFPEPIAHFIGRTRELKTIAQMVRQGCRLLEIADRQGRSGIGKSALAIQAVHYLQQALPQFQPDIRLYANLHGDDALPREARDVLQEFLLLHFRVEPSQLPQSLPALQQVYQQQLQGRQALIVLDNVSNLKQVEMLLPTAVNPECLVLMVSRQPVLPHESGETLFLEGLTASTAVQLLQTMVGGDRIEPDSSALRQLLQLSGGLPLTLRMLGAFLRYQPQCTLEMLVLQLQQERIKHKALPPQAIDVMASLSLMYRSLKPDQQEFLQRLSVLRGDDFDLSIVAHLNHTEDPHQTLTRMKSLITQQWIFRGVGAKDRFQMHELVRRFVWDTIPAADRRTLILQALAWQDQQANPIAA
jgi:NB-ARC domain